MSAALLVVAGVFLVLIVLHFSHLYLTLAGHAVHAHLLSWFLDAPASPFGVHRMAFAGKSISGCGSGPARRRVSFIPFLLRSLCLYVLWIATYTFRILHAHCPHICHRCSPIVLWHPHPPLRTPLAQYLRRDALGLLPLYLTCFHLLLHDMYSRHRLSPTLMLVNAIPACGLGVSVATDGTLYKTELARRARRSLLVAFVAFIAVEGKEGRNGEKGAGSRARGGTARVTLRRTFLLTIALFPRCCVNLLLCTPPPFLAPHSHSHPRLRPNTLLTLISSLLYTFPWSVGIAGGRPSSSYYFVGAQGGGLLYLDPHHSRPCVPLRPFVPATPHAHPGLVFSRSAKKSQEM
ncbi:hypothetical protein B0H13DRAFT_2314157 [Mycena leptocephala]|nr:hypothetical protein B0H13DRAFT_2314157 [Mycena leptocephala]